MPARIRDQVTVIASDCEYDYGKQNKKEKLT
jgi:hypothetical protein